LDTLLKDDVSVSRALSWLCSSNDRPAVENSGVPVETVVFVLGLSWW
jgi:hypothetical protein